MDGNVTFLEQQLGAFVAMYRARYKSFWLGRFTLPQAIRRDPTGALPPRAFEPSNHARPHECPTRATPISVRTVQPPVLLAELILLDRIGIIELRPLNRYRLKLAKTFRWRPHGPVMGYFRDNALLDYFSGGFDGAGEGLLLVHGSVSRSLAPSFVERMQRVAQDFAQQHLADQKLPDKEREGYTLLLGMRSWEFEAFAQLRR